MTLIMSFWIGFARCWSPGVTDVGPGGSHNETPLKQGFVGQYASGTPPPSDGAPRRTPPRVRVFFSFFAYVLDIEADDDRASIILLPDPVSRLRER